MAPRPGIQQQLAAIWSELLGVERVGASDNFFDLGGNSLLALRLVSRLRKELAVDMPLATLFIAPNVSELAESILKLRSEAPSSELPPIRSIPREGPLRASFAQERYWYLQQSAGKAPVVHMHGGLTFKGKLDVDALRAAIDVVVARHEALRMGLFERDGELFQVVAPKLTFELPLEDLRSLPDEERPRQVRQFSRRRGPRRSILQRPRCFAQGYCGWATPSTRS